VDRIESFHSLKTRSRKRLHGGSSFVTIKIEQKETVTAEEGGWSYIRFTGKLRDDLRPSA